MKRIIASCIILLAHTIASAQSSHPLSIEECYKLSRQHYPLLKQMDVIIKSREYSIDNISKAWYPQVNLNGQASYQSDVTQIPIKLPNIIIENPGRDQYRVYAEVTQSLYDGGISKQQKQLLENSTTIEAQKVDIELYKLKERITQLFFGILLINEQLNQVQIIKNDIHSGINKVEGAVTNGAALKSSADILKAELLKNEQHETELKAGRKAYLIMLGLFINKQLDQNTVLDKPQSLPPASSINRPELNFFELQKKSTIIQDRLISAKNLPRIGLFLQGGFGKPALNLLKNQFEAYYIGGLRVSWSLAGLYTERKDGQQQDLNRLSLDIQKETFLFNTNISLSQQAEDIKKIQELIQTDNEIISLRISIKHTAYAQLNYGTITSNDYLREVNAEDQARQSLILHQIQLLMTQYTYRVTAGN